MKNNHTICHYIAELNTKKNSNVAIKTKKDNQWQDISWQQYYADIEVIGHGLLSLGISAQKRVAIMSNTRYEWSVCDYAIMGTRAITVPLYHNNTNEDLIYILNNCEAEVLILESRQMVKNWSVIQSHCQYVKWIICMESIEFEDDNIFGWQELINRGAIHLGQNPNLYNDLCKKTLLEEIATIIYTSGTTGQPKGVVLTHEQIMSEISDAFPAMGATATDTSLSFLPYAHVLGRIEHWGHVFIGFTMAYAESIDKIKHDLQEIKPTFLISVPRIFEKIYSTIWTQLENNPIKRNLFNWALSIGDKCGAYKIKKTIAPIHLLAQLQFADQLVLSNIRNIFGGRLRFAISGGAPLSREISMFFHSCGILILEGYGLTETTAAICVNRPFDYNFGSVGKPLGDVQIKIAEDGELLVRSKKIMREYYKDNESTKKSFTDGWFHTGDIGEVLSNGDIKITDRKKDLIKTAGGKYVAPQRLENLLKKHPAISHVLIHGDQKKYVVALITLDKSYLIKFAKELNLQFQDLATLTQLHPVQELVRKIVAEANTQLASFESIKKFLILPDEFSVEGGELTPSLKVKRKVLDQRFQDKIESLY